MTPIADMVRKLFEKGVDQEAILIAIEAAEQVMCVSMSTRHPPDSRVDEAAEKRREWDREYRRRTRPSTRHPPESTRHPPDTENASLSKKERKEEEKEESKGTTRGARLPVGWTPTPQDWAVSCELLSEKRAKLELDKFTDHWKQQPGSRGVKLDWNAAWRNWTRRAAEYGAQRNGRRTVHDAAKDLHENLISRVLAFDEPAPSSLRGGEGSDVVRLLPPGRRE